VALEVGLMNILIGLGLAPGAGEKFGDDVEKGVGPASERIGKKISEDLAKSFNKAGKGLTAGVTAPILGLATGAIAASEKVDDALDVIRRSTGATGEEFNGLRADFEAIATSSAVDFERTAEIVSLLNQRLDLTGKPLQEVGRALADLDTVTGEQTNLDGFTRVLGAFNVPADQAVETINKLLRASQETGVPVNKLTEGLVSQSAAFAELGFGLDETAALLGQFEASGVNTSTVLGGLRANIIRSTKAGDDGAKATAELAKAQDAIAVLTLKAEAAQADYNDKLEKYGEGSKEALSAEASLLDIRQKLESANIDAANSQQVLDELVKSSGANAKGAAQFFREGVKEIEGFLAAGDESAAQARAAELFGARTFLDALDAIKRGQFDIEGTVSAIQGGQETVGGLADEFEGLPEKLDQLKKSTVFALKPLGEELIPAITDALDAAVPIIQGLAESFKNLSPETRRLIIFVGGLAAAIGPLLIVTAKVITSIGAIGKAIKALSLVLTASPWLLVAAAAIAAVVLIYKNWDSIKEFFANLFEDIGRVGAAAFEGLVAGAAVVVEFIIGVFQALGGALAAIWEGIRAAGIAVWDGLKAAAQFAVDVIIGFFYYLGAGFVAIWDGIKAVAQGVWDGLVAVAQFVVGAIIGYFTGLLTIYQTIWNGIRDAGKAAFEVVVGVASSVVARLRSIFGGVRDFFAGIWNGIRDTARGAVDAVLRLFTNLRDRIVSIFKGILDLPRQALQSLPGGLGNLFRAQGGPVEGGKPYIVGEQGPELVVPRTSGVVVSNQQLAGALSGAGGRGGDTYEIVITNPEPEPASTSIPAALRRASYLRSR